MGTKNAKKFRMLIPRTCEIFDEYEKPGPNNTYPLLN